MNILVACEESQVVATAFRNKGHIAFSADLQRCSGGHPEYHFLGDVLNLLKTPCSFNTQSGFTVFIDKWDMVIAHPPCTYLAVSGSCNNYTNGVLNEERIKKGHLAAEFFNIFLNYDCPKICIENPRPQKRFGLPACSQVIEPYMFDEPYTKRTYLWLKGLPPLFSTILRSDVVSWCGVHSSAKIRSKTFPKIALAMADQWG